MENYKRDMADIREVIDMMESLVSGKFNQPERIKAYIPELKEVVGKLEAHTKNIHRLFDILELGKMNPEELSEIAKIYGVKTEYMGKQTIMYEIIDKQGLTA